MQRRLPDISKINGLIGYKPTLDLGQIVERVIAYHRDKERQPARISASAALGAA